MTTACAWGTLGSPVGPLTVVCSPAGVAEVSFGPPRAATMPARAGAAEDLLAQARRQLTEYFRGERRAFDVPVDFSALAGARRGVLSVLHATVGFGQTITYGALAARAGLTGPAVPARAVGQIMGSNPCPLIVPCHRVVAGQGLGGYSGGAGVEVKRWLLTFEGALPATLDWDPAGLG